MKNSRAEVALFDVRDGREMAPLPCAGLHVGDFVGDTSQAKSTNLKNIVQKLLLRTVEQNLPISDPEMLQESLILSIYNTSTPGVGLTFTMARVIPLELTRGEGGDRGRGVDVDDLR